MTSFNDSTAEAAALGWLAGLARNTAHVPDIAPVMPKAERADYGQVELERRLRDALAQLNPIPRCFGRCLRRLTQPAGSSLGALTRDSRASRLGTS